MIRLLARILLVSSLTGQALAETECDVAVPDFEEVHHVNLRVDGIYDEASVRREMFQSAMIEMGNWSFLYTPLDLETGDIDTQSPKEEVQLSLARPQFNLTPRRYRMPKFEELVVWRKPGGKYSLSVAFFESSTNLTYYERLLTGAENERSLGVALLGSIRWR